MPITPGRRIWLEVDGPEQSTVTRPHFRKVSKASQIGQADGWTARIDPFGAPVRVAGNVNTIYVPGDVWTLAVLSRLAFNLTTTEFPGAALGPSDFTTAPWMFWPKNWRPLTDLPGSGYTTTPPGPGPGGTFVSLLRAMRRRVPAGQPWDHANNSLGADQSAYPPPSDPDYPNTLPVDRVAVSNVDYEANQGFGVTFALQSDFYGIPTFMRIYFGGPTPLQPASQVGGAFCLVLRGSGGAILYERNAVSAWERRMVFQWAEPTTIGPGSHQIQIWPMARDRILFVSRLVDTPHSPAGLVQPAGLPSRFGNPAMTLYRDAPGATGHAHLNSMTGVGKFRIDVSRTYRMPFHPWLIKFPASGVVRDEPFFIPRGVNAGEPMELITDGFVLNGSAFTGVIRDADTGLILGTNALGQFLTLQSKQQYYAEFTLFSSANQNQTPVLFGYSVRSSANSIIRTKTPVRCKVRDGSVTGPDIFPGHGSAEVKLRRHPNVGATVTGEVSTDPEPMDILRLHDRRYCRLKVEVPTTGPSGDPRGYVILHQGETWQPKAQLRGRAAMNNVDWWDFTVPMVDMWLRVQKQFNWQQLDYTKDPIDAAHRPPVVMAVIRDLLIEAGIPADELDTPGWDDPTNVRLWHSPTDDRQPWYVQPGSNLGHLVKRLAFDYLGKVLVHDPNAFQGSNGLRGVWRVLDPPQPNSGTAIWQEPPVYDLTQARAAFYVRRPTWAETSEFGIHVIEDEGALGSGAPGVMLATYVKDGSYFTYPEAPENTAMVLTGHGGLLPKTSGSQKKYAFLWNPKAVDWNPASPTADPTSIDYMDRIEPLFVNDPTFINEESLNWMATRIARQALRGRLWCEWVSPGIFVTDPEDALLGTRRRPLRVYDLVQLFDEHGTVHPVMVRSANYFWRGASQMWCWIQGLLLDAR